MRGLAAAGRQSETEQTNNDAQFARHQQQRADKTSESQKALDFILRNQTRKDFPEAEVT